MNNQNLIELLRIAVYQMKHAHSEHYFLLSIGSDNEKEDEALQEADEVLEEARNTYVAFMQQVAERLGVEYRPLEHEQAPID